MLEIFILRKTITPPTVKGLAPRLPKSSLWYHSDPWCATPNTYVRPRAGVVTCLRKELVWHHTLLLLANCQTIRTLIGDGPNRGSRGRSEQGSILCACALGLDYHSRSIVIIIIIIIIIIIALQNAQRGKKIEMGLAVISSGEASAD